MEDTHMHKNFAKTGLELRIFFAFSSHFLSKSLFFFSLCFAFLFTGQGKKNAINLKFNYD